MNSKEIRKLEKLLDQKIRDIYHKNLEHDIDNIHFQRCDFTLIIILEGTITTIEKLLYHNDRKLLAQNIREFIDSMLLPQVRKTIEQTTKVEVIDFLSDTTIENNLTGAIIILNDDKNS